MTKLLAILKIDEVYVIPINRSNHITETFFENPGHRCFFIFSPYMLTIVVSHCWHIVATFDSHVTEVQLFSNDIFHDLHNMHQINHISSGHPTSNSYGPFLSFRDKCGHNLLQIQINSYSWDIIAHRTNTEQLLMDGVTSKELQKT